jgi:spore maturation protein CgeB
MKILYILMAYGALGGIPTVLLIEKSIFNTLKKLVKDTYLYNHYAIAKKLHHTFKEEHQDILNKDGNKYTLMLGYEASKGLLQAVGECNPDFIFVVNGHLISPEILKEIRKKGIKTILWFMDDPYQSVSGLALSKYYDYVFTVDSAMLPYYKSSGMKNVFHLPLGFDPEIFRPLEITEKYISEVNFIGYYFPNRLEILNCLGSYLSNLHTLVIGDKSWRHNIEKQNPLWDCIETKIIDHEEAAKYYCGAKINLNIHRDSIDQRYPNWNPLKVMGKTPNDRVFTISGCGAFQLVDDTRSDLNDFYEIGKEIITFHDVEDLKNKISYYLKNENERRQIAENARRRALAEHTYEHRLRKLLEIVANR